MINFNNIETNTGSFDSLPENWYTIKSETAELVASKNGPNTMIKVKFGVVSPVKYVKRKVWNNFNLGAKSLWAVKVFLEAAGIDSNSLGDIDEKQLSQRMVGLVVGAYLEPTTTTTGKPSNNITNYRRVATDTTEVPLNGEPASKGNAAMFK